MSASAERSSRQRQTDDGEGGESLKLPSRYLRAQQDAVAVTASHSMLRLPEPELVTETVNFSKGGPVGAAETYASDVSSVPGAFHVKGSEASANDDDFSDLHSWSSYTVEATLVPDSPREEEKVAKEPDIATQEHQAQRSQDEDFGQEKINSNVVHAEPLSTGANKLKPLRMVSKLIFRHRSRKRLDSPLKQNAHKTEGIASPAAKVVDKALALATATPTPNPDQLLSPNGKLYGRDKEIESLGDCLKKSVIDRNTRQLVFVSGMSGSGKTALVQSLRGPCKSLNGIFVSGKFDTTRQHEPYSGIIPACTEICQEILSFKGKTSTKRSFDKIRKDIVRELGSELQVLARVLPVLEDIVDQRYRYPADIVVSPMEAKHRLTFAFQRLIRVVSSNFHPFILHLDDAQSADLASLELMEKLSTDHENPNLMIIVGYRSNEVDNGHPLTETILNLCSDNLDVTKINVEDLGAPAITELLADVIGEASDSEIRGLAQVCQAKTGGNVFFLIQFISMLQEQSLLKYEMGHWTWDARDIVTKTQSTDNVVDLVKRKMWKLTDEDNTILQIAACLGSPFDLDTLRVAWFVYSEAKTRHESDETIDRWVTTSLAEGYIEEHGESHYQWIHDKIQEAAASLVYSRWSSKWNYRIGQILCQNLSKEQLYHQIFPVVNLLNTGVDQSVETDERFRLSELNLQAALKALEFSAFDSARVYTRNGVALLPENQWTSHFSLAVQLHSTAAEVEGYFGNEEKMAYHCRQVLERRDTSMFDKYRVFNVLIDFSASCNRHLQAIGLCLCVLKQSGGIMLPKGHAAILSKARRVLSQTRPLSIGRIRELKETQDTDRIAQMKILEKLAICCYEIGSPLTALVIDHSVKMTLDHGICETSPVSFALTGAMMAGRLGDYNGASRYGQHALFLMDKLKAKSVDSKVRVLLHNIILPWTIPVRDQLGPLLEGYQSGLKSGDVDSAIQCMIARSAISFVCGRPLEEIEKDCRLAVNKILDFNRFKGMNYIVVMWQVALNLMGQSEQNILLTGEAMDEAQFLGEARLPEDGPALAHFQAHRICLYAFFGEFKLGANLVVANDAQLTPGVAFSMAHEYMKGVCLFASARSTTTRTFKTHARKVLKTIEKWVKDGNPNVRHCELLLKAEKAALDGKILKAKNLFDAGLGLAERGGFIHHVALANERFGEFLLKDVSDRQLGLRRINDAIKAYESWGAHAKVRLLRKKYPDL